MSNYTPFHRRGFAGVLLVLLMAVVIIGILYVGKWGSSDSYVETTIKAKEQAKDVTSSVNMSSVHRSLQIYAFGHDGKFPETPEKLMVEANLPLGYVWLPSRRSQGAFAVYVPGQDESMPASNILLYQSVVDADGTCMVLRLGGSIEYLTADRVREALAETEEHIEKRRR